MVDFKRLSKLNAQEQIVLALFKAHTHKKILVVARDRKDLTGVFNRMTQNCQNAMLTFYGKPIEGSVHHLYYDDADGSIGGQITFVAVSHLDSMEGSEFDLIWFRYDPTTPQRPAMYLALSSACRVGYNPIILDGFK